MGIEKIDIDLDVKVGDGVNVTSGPFAGQFGNVLAINQEKQVLTVNLMMFGRDTPVDIEFGQVHKLD
jgi:transcriptional antiterminator NusG